MVLVNSLSLPAGIRQNEAKKTVTRTSKDDGFYSFLSRNMSTGETSRSAAENKTASLVSSGMQRARNEKAVTNDRSSHTGITKDDSGVTAEVSNINVRENEKKSRSVLYLIEEIMAALKELAAYFGNAGTEDESVTVSFSHEIRSLVNDTVSMLTELANCTGGNIAEVAQELVSELKQAINGDSFVLIIGNGLSAEPDKLNELIGKMMNESEKLKTELASVEAGENVVPENRDLNDIPEDDDALLQPETESGKVEHADRDNADTDNAMEEEFKEEKTTAGNNETVISEKSRVNGINLRDDFSRVFKNDHVQNEQSNGPVYTIPEKSGIVEKTDIFRQVAEKVKVLSDPDRSEIVIQLKPESLGKIQLQVIHERGEIIAKFMAENEQVKSILESNMQLLRDALEKSGVDIQSLSVSVGHQNQDDGRSDYRSRQPYGNLNRVYYQEVPEAASVVNTYEYAGADELYGYAGSEINLIA